jgi:sugar phosphate isomerase/epimerase
MKKQIIILTILSLINLSVRGQSQTGMDQVNSKSAQLLKSWQVGTSSGIFVDFSQKEFDELKINGIKYIELVLSVLRNKTQEESEEWIKDLKRKTDNAGIEIWSIHLPFSRVLDISTNNMIKECSRIMALCKPLNPHKYIIHPSSEPITDDERSIRMEHSIASLKILTEEVKKYKAQLVIEDLPRTCLGNTSDEILKIVNTVGNGIGVCFDSNHLLHEKPEEFVLNVGDLIKTVHMSDYDGIDERHWLPGEGIINWVNVISALVNNGYKGPFMFETSRRKSASGRNEPSDILSPKDLADCFQELKTNYLKSLK